jgi:hypothetical protein
VDSNEEVRNYVDGVKYVHDVIFTRGSVSKSPILGENTSCITVFSS